MAASVSAIVAGNICNANAESTTSTADEVGVPTEGSVGVTLTVQELMDAKLLRPLEEQRTYYPPPKKQKIPGGGELADPKWVRSQVAPRG